MGRVRLGGAAIGNLYRARSDEACMRMLDAAIGAGMTSIDTAPYYGHGRSEARIGAFLAGSPVRAALSTKVGRRLDPSAAPGSYGFADPLPFEPVFDYSRDGVLRTFEASLARLHVDRVETLFLHDVGIATHGEGHDRVMHQALDEALPAMLELKAAGVVDRVGVGVNEIAAADTLVATGMIDVVLIAGRYTLIDRSASALLERCTAAGVAVLAAGVYNSGLLAGGDTYDYARASPELLARRDLLGRICAAHDVPLAAAALAMPLAHPAVEQIVVGLGSVEEVAATVALLAVPIPDGLFEALVAC